MSCKSCKNWNKIKKPPTPNNKLEVLGQTQMMEICAEKLTFHLVKRKLTLQGLDETKINANC